MKGFLLLIGILAIVLLIPAVFAIGVPSPSSAFSSVEYSVYEIGEPIQLTNDPHYDRNPSFFKANDGRWWLFFVRSQDGDPNYGDLCEGTGCDQIPGCNCDAASYDVYYITSNDNGNTWSTPVKVDECSTGQRGMAAFQDNTGKIWVFISGPGASNIRYCTSSDNGATWTGPIDTGLTGSHIDAFQGSDGLIYIFYESGGIQYAYFDGLTWTSGTVDGTAGMGIPKAMEDLSGKLYVVYANWAGGTYYYSVSTDGTTWTNKGALIDVPNTISCDPVMYQDSEGIYWLFYAPWDSVDNSQWIEFITSTNAKTWSDPTGLTNGGYYEDYWWDMWPEVGEGSDLLIFYTSEQSDNGFYRKDGDIWMLKIEDRIAKLQQENQNQWDSINNLASQITGMISDVTNIENTIVNIQNAIEMLKNQLKDIFDYLEEIEAYLKSGYGVPEPNYCGDGICDVNIGETSSTCPEDCVDGALPSEVFITEGWKVTCPETFDSYNIIGCRAELFKGSWSLANYTMDPLETRKTNWHAGYLLRLYGIPGAS